VLDDRASWTVGLYDEDGTQVTARFTGLPIWEDDGRRYLHLALALRYNGDDDGQLRFSGRPESNVTDLYVDTGKIPAEHAWHTGLEALWADGPYSLLAEVAQARVSSASTGDPSFSGWYLTGSWTVTGSGPRPYDRKVNYARRMPVAEREGEVEIVSRIGRVDLDDALVSGGTLDKCSWGRTGGRRDVGRPRSATATRISTGSDSMATPRCFSRACSGSTDTARAQSVTARRDQRSRLAVP
jgi:phosphate-selective porin